MDEDVLRALVECIERRTGVVVPSSAADFRYQYYDWQDEFINLRFSIPASELTAFVSQESMAKLELQSDSRSVSSGGASWWHPDRASELLSGGARLSNGDSLNLLIDLDDWQTLVVFLEWHEL